jgi:glycerophosphoryl diester phosphodiesterase
MRPHTSRILAGVNAFGNASSARPLVIGHRGASGHALENTLEAFGRAVTLGCDAVELDIHATRDGALVVHHDFVLAETGAISDLNAHALRSHRLRNDEPMPLLEEALEACHRLTVYVEAKGLPPSADVELLKIIASHPPGRIQIHSFDHRIIARLRRLNSDVPLGVLSRSYPVEPVSQVLAAGATTLWQEAHWIDQALVDQCHAAGVAVIAWTVNEVSEARRLAAMGVDGLCGDWPERLVVGD